MSRNNRISRAEARIRRQREWEREKAQSIELSNAVLGTYLGLLRSATLNGALQGRGHWTNRYGTREDFVVFVPAPDTLAWRKCLKSNDPHVRPFLSVCYEKRNGDFVGQCYHNYILSPTQISRVDGSGWYVISRPDSQLMKVATIFEELNLFLESIPLLGPYALRKGRVALRGAEANFNQLWQDA